MNLENLSTNADHFFLVVVAMLIFFMQVAIKSSSWLNLAFTVILWGFEVLPWDQILFNSYRIYSKHYKQGAGVTFFHLLLFFSVALLFSKLAPWGKMDFQSLFSIHTEQKLVTNSVLKQKINYQLRCLIKELLGHNSFKLSLLLNVPFLEGPKTLWISSWKTCLTFS